MGLAASEVTASETRRCAAVSRGVVRVPRAGERLKRSRMGTSAGSASSGLHRISGPRFLSGEPVAFSAPQIGIPAGGRELDWVRRCQRRWTGSWQRWSVTKTRICTCCMRSTNSISFVTTATKHSCTTRLRELRDLSSLPSHREWPTCLPMTTESSIAYSFSIRTTLERFCRSIRFELGNRLHCKSGALESADAKREVVCELLRPQELSLPLAVLLNTRICIANLGPFASNLRHLYSIVYDGPPNVKDLTRKAFWVELALAKGEC